MRPYCQTPNLIRLTTFFSFLNPLVTEITPFSFHAARASGCVLLFSVFSSLLVLGGFPHNLQSSAIHLKVDLPHFIQDFKAILMKEYSSIHILVSFQPVSLLATPVV